MRSGARGAPTPAAPACLAATASRRRWALPASDCRGAKWESGSPPRATTGCAPPILTGDPMRSPSGAMARGRLLISTHPETVTARSLRANPALVHLESGEQVMIDKGTAKRLDDRALLARFGEGIRSEIRLATEPPGPRPQKPRRRHYCRATTLRPELGHGDRDRRNHHPLELRRQQLSLTGLSERTIQRHT
jgi:hypothetical protein